MEETKQMEEMISHSEIKRSYRFSNKELSVLQSTKGENNEKFYSKQEFEKFLLKRSKETNFIRFLNLLDEARDILWEMVDENEIDDENHIQMVEDIVEHLHDVECEINELR